jgi:serine/threonine protein kinase
MPLLGTGGMGEVYRARDTALGREVAIKVLLPHLAARPDALRRFEQEARTVAALADPNIVTVFDVAAARAGPTDGRVCMRLRFARDADRSGPFVRPTSADSLAAVLETQPPLLPVDPTRPPIVDRVVSRCLAKDARDRFQSANDLQFVLESVRDSALTPVGTTEPRRPRISPAWWLAGAAALMLGIGSLVVSPRNEPATVRPSIRATVVVPASARPIAPAISPDGKWVAYVGLGDGRPDLFAQFINGGAPVNLTLEADMPVQNRTVVGGIDVLPDGSGIAVAG